MVLASLVTWRVAVSSYTRPMLPSPGALPVLAPAPSSLPIATSRAGSRGITWVVCFRACVAAAEEGYCATSNARPRVRCARPSSRAVVRRPLPLTINSRAFSRSITRRGRPRCWPRRRAASMPARTGSGSLCALTQPSGSPSSPSARPPALTCRCHPRRSRRHGRSG